MTDIADSTASASVEAAPVESPVESTPVESTPVESSILDTELPAGMRTFTRDYVEKARAEAAENRTRARDLEQQLAEHQAKLQRFEAFDGYSDEDMSVWTDLASNWKIDEVAAAQQFQRIAQNVLGDPTSTDAERAEAQAILDDPNAAVQEALTPERVREIAREERQLQEAEAAHEAGVAQVFTRIREAGYEDGSPECWSVLWYANNKTEGDVGAAIQMQKDWEQSIVDRYVQSMAKGGTPVRLPASGEPGSPQLDGPKNPKEAGRMAEASLRERRPGMIATM